MNTREQHALRTFIFRPGETVYLLVHQKTRKVAVKVTTHLGKGLLVRKSGPLQFQLPVKGTASIDLSVQVDFKERPNRLHLARGGVNVQMVGSEGTLYHHSVLAGPSSSLWNFRISSIAKGKTLFFCLNPGCRANGKGVEGRGIERECGTCRKGKLVSYSF
jgi:hypothetical protein